MNAFHSVWTAPFFSLWEITSGIRPAAYEMDDYELLCMILSALKWREKNGSIRLVTDERGESYFRALGLTDLWDLGIEPFQEKPEACGIDPFLLWAAGKIFALAQQQAPCVMIDTDFIVWEEIARTLSAAHTAVIHREALDPQVYPGREAFEMKAGYAFDAAWDWTQQACNTALCFFDDGVFKQYYTDASKEFMRCLTSGQDRVTGMVFAEQRLLAMCAHQKKLEIFALESLAGLEPGRQSRFTHLWGYKDVLRRQPGERTNFCRRCVDRIRRDFPAAADMLRRIPSLAIYIHPAE